MGQEEQVREGGGRVEGRNQWFHVLVDSMHECTLGFSLLEGQAVSGHNAHMCACLLLCQLLASA